MSLRVNEGQPFSATWNKVRGKAGGMTYGKADTEVKDNSFDAGATHVFTKILSISEGEHQGNYILHSDNGSGSACLPHLYGLGKTMEKKTDNATSGMFNSGHTTSAGYYNPEFIYSETSCERSYKSLIFNSGPYSEKIDACKDRCDVQVADYMTCNGERLPSHARLLDACISSITSPVLKKHMEDVRDHATSHMTHILKLPIGASVPDAEYTEFLDNERMYYFHGLKYQGRTIVLETSTGVVYTADASNAIDPLWDRDTFKALESTLTVKRSPLGEKKLMAKMVLKNAEDSVARTLYIYNSTDGRYKMPVVEERTPVEWKEELPTLMTLRGYTNALSEGAAKQQLSALNQHKTTGSGSELKAVDEIRGVFFEWTRILGKPYWRPGGKDALGYGAERNSGNLRCYMKAEGDKMAIAELLGLQSNKHNTDFNDSDIIIHRFLYCVFGMIVNKYTACTLRNSVAQNGWTEPWPVAEIVDHIVKRRVRPPPSPTHLVPEPESEPAPAPAPVSETEPLSAAVPPALGIARGQARFITDQNAQFCIGYDRGIEILRVAATREALFRKWFEEYKATV